MQEAVTGEEAGDAMSGFGFFLHLDFYFGGVCEGVPEGFGLVFGDLAVVNTQAVFQGIFIARFKCPVGFLDGAEIKKHIAFGPYPHGFGVLVVFGVAHE